MFVSESTKPLSPFGLSVPPTSSSASAGLPIPEITERFTLGARERATAEPQSAVVSMPCIGIGTGLENEIITHNGHSDDHRHGDWRDSGKLYMQ